MQFDIFTVMAASSVVVVVLGGAILLFWSRDRAAYWMAWAAVSFAVLAAGNALAMARPMLHINISAGVGTSFLIVGFGIFWQAMRVFEGRAPLLWPLPIAVGVWVILFGFTPFHYDLAVRIMVSSSLMTAGIWLGAYELWLGRREVLPSRYAAIGVLVFLGSIFAMRVVLAYVAPYPVGSQPVDGAWVAGFNGLLVLSAILTAAFLISLNLERRELRQRELARTDPLTGLLNRRALDERYARPDVAGDAAVVVFDLDNFKLINDIYGHATGDALILEFSRICMRNVRQTDIAGRLGGEEFVLVLPGVSQEIAWKTAERIRRAFEDTIVETAEGEVVCTVSAGVDGSKVFGESLQDVLERADNELYRAKRDGRNRVRAAQNAQFA